MDRVKKNQQLLIYRAITFMNLCLHPPYLWIRKAQALQYVIELEITAVFLNQYVYIYLRQKVT